MKSSVGSGLVVLAVHEQGWRRLYLPVFAFWREGRKSVRGKANVLEALAGEAKDEGASQKLKGVPASSPQDAGALREQK